jgi:conjugative relaxase-like TrwC/TraI family protein
VISADGVAGAGYYSGGGGSDNGAVYYTGAVGAVEPPGVWSGAFAEALGLSGDVDPKVMAAVFDLLQLPDGTPIGAAPRSFRGVEERVAERLAGLVDPLPEDVARIRSEVERETRSAQHGVDLTYSPQKSVTVAHAAGWRGSIESTRAGDASRASEYESIRAGIEEDVRAANGAALAYLESVATTRQGAGAGHAVVWVPVDGLAVASFLQHTSRSNDPQLHVHNAVLNRAERSTDGAVRTLAMTDLVAQKMVASAIADRVLAERLADRGIATAMRPDGIAREVLGVDVDVMEAYSQRSRDIVAAAAPAIAAAEERLGRELSDVERGAIKEWANLATRDAKVKDVDVDTLLDGWQDRLTAELGMGLVPIADHLLLSMSAGPVERDGTFSPDAVASEALARVSARGASFTYGDLMVEVEHSMPLLGIPAGRVAEVLHAATSYALQSQGVVQVAGNAGTVPPSSLVAGSYVMPSSARYATAETLAGERAVREAATAKSGHTVDAAAVDAWLSERYPTIGTDQRAAVVGLASRDVALAQLVGPAGTGKSFTAGALAGAWGDLSDGGRVVGLAVSQAAANVLADDGVPVTANIAAWRASQARLERGSPTAEDMERAIGPRDLVVIDEASMVDTAQVSAVLDVAQSIGARVVFTGDHRQLGAIGAGGAMGLVEGRGDTYTLTDARRFSEAWERTASLGLREGSTDALREYDVHGRLVEADSMEAAIATAARAAAAERIAGRSVAVTTDRNVDAYAIAHGVRDHLVAAGLVEEAGVSLGRTGGVAGIGDEVMTRHLDWSLGVLNGSTFTVVGTGDDGSLSVVNGAGAVLELPAAYVAEHVQHAYASTVHAAQGGTVDVAFTVTDGSSSASALYVGMTRGQDRNTAIVSVGQSDAGLVATTEHGGELRVETPEARPSAFAVLSDSLGRDSEQRAALVEQEIDTAHLGSMATLMAQLEDSTDRACRARLDGHLDQLVTDGVLSEDARASIAADPSTAHLSRVCRAAEQSGHDPAAVLRESLERGSLAGSRSEAKVIAGRIATAVDVSAASASSIAVPAGLPPEWTAYLENLHGQAEQRSAELGVQAVEDAPAWATRALGPVPEDATERLEWQERAGSLAAYREASGHEDEGRALPSAPGITQTEARAAWWGAWDALGRPQETRPEAALSDGALQARVTAWEREQAWAPAHADESLRTAELDAEDARREAILARASGDDDAAEEWEAEAAARGTVARAMSRVEEARGEWATNTAVTRDLAERAAEELDSRGLTRGEEPDRVSAEEWLDHQREVDARDEAVREVTELDVPLVEDVAESVTRDEEEADGGLQDELSEPDRGRSGSEREVAAAKDVPPEPPVLEATSDATSGDDADARGSDDSPAKAADEEEAEADEPVDEPEESVTRDDAADDDDDVDEAETDPRAVIANYAVWNPAPAPEDEDEAEARPSPAQVLAPTEPTDVELETLLHVATAASDRVADRSSEEAAHDAWEASQDTAREHDEAPVAEHVLEDD